MAYIFHYERSPLEIMCIAFIVLLLENTKLFYIFLLFCLHIEILSISTLYKCLIAIKCSKSRMEILQIFSLGKLSHIIKLEITLFLFQDSMINKQIYVLASGAALQKHTWYLRKTAQISTYYQMPWFEKWEKFSICLLTN